MSRALTQGRAARVLALVPVVFSAAMLVAMAVALRRTYGGDAAIYLPYARNLADGHPFSFNPGDFSSGSTSPLWAVVLSVPYVLGLGFKAAKAWSAVFLLAAYLTSFAAARKVSGSILAAGIGSLWVAAALPLYGLIMFESSLVVLLAAASLWLGARVLERRDLGPRSLAPLVCVWAALPLARPEAAVLVAVEAMTLIYGVRPVGRRAVLTTLGAVGIAALPALAYFGYSLAELGVASTSMAGRALYLRETSTARLGPLYLSTDGLDYLTSWPAIAAALPGAAGWAAALRAPRLRPIALYALAGLAAYAALVSFVSPGSFDTARYLLPVSPFLATGVAVLLTRLPRVRAARVGFAAVALVLVIPVFRTLDGARDLAAVPYTFDTITQRSAARIVNGLAAPGDRVLAYEVQSRYWLRRDVEILSLDGITDGKVFPYEKRGRLPAFLLRYRPRFWIADTATDIERDRPGVAIRRYLGGSLLTEVVKRMRADPRLRTTTVAGIEFHLLASRSRLPLGAGVWTMVFELRYA